MIGDSDLIDQDEKSGLDKVTVDQENGMDADDGEPPAQPLAEDSDSDDDGPVVISNRKKKHIAILDDSDEEEDDEPVVTETPITININEELGDSDKENAIPGMSRLCSQKDGVNKLKPPSRALPDDLFDAEMESDDDGPSKEKENNSDSGSDGSGSDDERPGSRRGSDRESGTSDQEDEDTKVSAALRKRLAQGAGKKSKKSGSGSEGGGGKSKVHKPSKAEVEEMYSESQRMTRESRVKIPYHQPQKLGLSVFLARTQQKQEQLQTVKQPGLAWKHTTEIKPTENKKKCPLDTPLGMRLSSNQENKSADSEETRTDLPTSADDNNKVKQDAQDSENVENVKKSLNFTVEEEDLDNLPDLVMDEEVTKVQYEVITSEEAKLLDTGGKEHDGEQNNKIAETSELVLDQKPEQESGYISVPTSEEENSGDHLKTDVELELRSSCTELAKSIEQEGQHLDSPVVVNNVKQSTFLTPKLATLSVNKFTPKLSGDPDSFIDLDDDDEPVSKTTPKVSADLEKLMERVIQHSAKRLPKSKDVEMSVVRKEKGPNQQEELKLHKLSYHIEAENHTPGAKLLQLKEALNEKIRQKRQEARQKRQEMCSLDDEEGYDDDGDDIMDEEAELTDQTDTDQEEEEEVDDEEELLGNNEEEEEEVEERESNPFLDGEAEEDDEEMQNEDDLHLKLDSGEDESMQDTSGATETNVKSKDFLQSALKKTKTLDLFDEDANTESPTLSQNSTGCPPEISSRPFQQLSGSSDKTLVLEENNSPDLDVDILLDTQPVKNTSISMGGVSRDKDTSLMSDSSFEMYSTLIPAGQRTGQKQQQSERGDRETPDLFTPSSKSSLGITSTVNKNTSHLSDMALPVEDSQDLLVQSPVKASESGLKPMSNSLGFHFGIEESQSQLLDDDGLFKVRSEKKPARRQLLLDQSTRGSSTAEEELLGLCSGRFTEDSQQTDSRASKSLFGDNSQSTISSTNTNMDELLGLCSGRFTSQLLPSQAQDNAESIVGESQGSTQPGTRPFVVSTEDPEASPVKSSNQKKRKKKWRRAVLHDDDSNDSFEMVSDEGEEQGMVNGKSLDSDEEAVESGDEADQNSESDDEEMIQARQFKGFTQAKKHGKIRTEFVEEEAELSGSEYDSDENLDLAEKDDILEMEAGDLDDVGTEEELRNQVNRVHLKSMIDTDKKELRLMQEMYLQDGDMHSDGSGRQRNFRWRNIDADDDTQQDLFRSDDEDGEGEEGKEEQSWRVQRHEREKFLQEQKENEEDDTHNNSQLIKLGKVVFKPKKDSNTPPVVNKEKDSIPEVPAPKLLLAKPTSATKENFTKPKLPHHGSFLRRSKDALAKIAEMSKPASTNIGGARNSGKFVFQALSADEKEKEQEQKEQKRPQVKRSMSSAEGANKRPRLEKSNTLPANSIFKLM